MTTLAETARAVIAQAIENECIWVGDRDAEELGGHDPAALKAEMEHIADCMTAALDSETVAAGFTALMKATDELEEIANLLANAVKPDGMPRDCRRAPELQRRIVAVEASVRAAHLDIQLEIGRIDRREIEDSGQQGERS